MDRENMMKHTQVGKVKVFEEGNTEREILIVPSSALVNEAHKQEAMDQRPEFV